MINFRKALPQRERFLFVVSYTINRKLVRKMVDIDLKTDGKKFRYRAGGLLINDDKILFVRSSVGDYYYVIGGGVHIGESSEEAAEREFSEETGINAKADRLAIVCENFFKDKVGDIDGLDCHTLEFYYFMTADEKDIQKCKTISDAGEKLVWLTLGNITEYNIKPSFIKDIIDEIACRKDVIHIICDSDR